MDTIQHAYAGYLISLVLCNSLIFIAIMVFFGILPDLGGWLEKLIYKDNTRWNWYLYLHTNYWLCLIPSYGMHILLDKFTHGKGKRWWILKERLWLEILVWTILILIHILVL